MTDDPILPQSSFAPDLQTLATLAPVTRQSVVDAVADRLRGELVELTGRRVRLDI